MISTFRPHPLIIGGHLQTLATVFLPVPNIPYTAIQHHVSLPDGDQIVLHDDVPEGWSDGDPVTVMLHGLCGCYGASYMVRMSSKLNQRGVRVFRMDMRGCGAGRDLAKGLPHSGRSDDLAEAIKFISIQAPSSPLWIIGVSMGGNIVLKMLGELGAGKFDQSISREKIAKAAVIAPPVDLAFCCKNLNRFVNRLYGNYFIKNLKARVPPPVAARDDWKSINWEPRPKTLWDFDDRVTAPLSGFEGVEDYYAKAQSAPLLCQIEVPTMVLASKDDPIVPIQCLNEAKFSASMELHTTNRGGHVGFIGRSKLDTGDRRWMDAKLLDWFSRGE